jgi:hypothetical protein
MNTVEKISVGLVAEINRLHAWIKIDPLGGGLS